MISMRIAALLLSLPAPTEQEQALDDYLPTEHPLHALLGATADACAPRRLDTTEDVHEAFRYEWGTWCSTEKMDAVMELLGEIRLITGAYEDVMDGSLETTLVGDDADSGDGGDSGKETGKRIRIAGGKYYDVLLHVLPKGARYQHKWPEGSWTIVQPLTGLTEVAQLRGPDRDGFYSKMRPRDIRGGGDGSGSLGAGPTEGAEGYSTAGESCVKYLGGPLRSYTGKAMKSAMLEVVVRPPIEVNVDATGAVEDLEWESVERVLTRVVQSEVEEDEEKEGSSDLKEAHVSSASGNAAKNATSSTGLNQKLGMEFSNVGGLNAQLDDIARRVLASRANPAAARRLGVSHVRGILLSGPPGCGKTLLARELSRLLGAREPQIVNGPEILDKFIGEAERRVRELFLPAEREYEEVGDASALHIIILDEMDAIARKRGSMTSDTTGVRDSVVNQLLAKIDGVKEAPNILVVGLTNRPELLDPALLRPGRLEVQLRVELPDRNGRKDILAIHTRRMREDDALSQDALDLLDDMSDHGMGARTEHFSGAELAGLVRSAASFALARAVESSFDRGDESASGMVLASDLERALKEVRPALGTQDAVLLERYPFGISDCSSSMQRIMRDLARFTTPTMSASPRLHSLLLVGAGGSVCTGGAGVTAEGGGGDEARAAALIERFSEAREMHHSLLVLDDIEQICAGTGPGGYSPTMLSTLRALIRTPPPSSTAAKAGGQSKSGTSGKTLHIIATSSRPDAACKVLNEIFEETIAGNDANAAAQLLALHGILDDLAGDEALASKECEVI
ncbi:hypothetical protein ACHAXT_002437 [Thalassiosira profunda]